MRGKQHPPAHFAGFSDKVDQIAIKGSLRRSKTEGLELPDLGPSLHVHTRLLAADKLLLITEAWVAYL
jgi:hypothetical protein